MTWVAEALFGAASDKPIKRNTFQSIERGSLLWRKATGTGYADYLADDEMRELRLFFQQRHLLAHTQGIVDQNYLARSGDRRYALGQRIVVSDGDVCRCVDILDKLTAGMKAGPSEGGNDGARIDTR